MMPSKIQIPVAPSLLMPAQTYTLTECLALDNKLIVLFFI